VLTVREREIGAVHGLVAWDVRSEELGAAEMLFVEAERLLAWDAAHLARRTRREGRRPAVKKFDH
jgi:hypothetical protein